MRIFRLRLITIIFIPTKNSVVILVIGIFKDRAILRDSLQKSIKIQRFNDFQGFRFFRFVIKLSGIKVKRNYLGTENTHPGI